MSDLKIPVSSADHIQGEPKAIVTLVKYADYQCPYCAEAYLIVKALQRHFGKDLRFVYRNFPLTDFHPEAEPAAETAEFAGAHGRFWEAHNALYDNQPVLGPSLYATIIDELGLSKVELRQTLADHTYLPKIKTDFDGGAQSGVNGTPTFFVNGNLHQGGYDLGSLATTIEAYRRSAGVHHGARRSML